MVQMNHRLAIAKTLFPNGVSPNGAQLGGIGRVDHIFIGSRGLNPTAGTKAWGDGLRPL